ncbi:MAG: hypothetical protein ACFFHD_08430 [Promethearchaeota archaeon]
MAVLEVGINIGMKNLVDIKYYSSSDKILNPDIRAKFLTGLENFITDIFGDELNVISLSSFEIVCCYQMVQSPNKTANTTKPLLSYAIIEKSTDHNFVKKHLQEIISHFLNRYSLDNLFSKKPRYFKDFIQQIDEILGDLRLTKEDRIRSIFKY